MKTFLGWIRTAAILAVIVGLLVTAGVLQEFAGDSIPDAVRAKGISLPLKDPWVLVSLQKMSLRLMDGDTVVQGYDIGFGEGPPGRIGVQSRGTPLGEFEIVARYKRKDVLSRGSRFIQINYPRVEDAEYALFHGIISSGDRDRIVRAINSGEAPPYDTPLGGPLGIQGNYFFFHSRHFSEGSVALSNGDVNELYEYLTAGVRVIIEEY